MTFPISVSTRPLPCFHGKQCVVNDVSFTLRRSEVPELLGHNGAGNRSTLQMLASILLASAGSLKGEERLINILPLTAQDGRLVLNHHQFTKLNPTLLISLLFSAAGGWLWWWHA